MRTSCAALLVGLWPTVLAAQDAPLSAIDWLSNSVAVAVPEPPTTNSALPETITVRPLDHPVPDAVGLMDAEAAGLPADLWVASDTRTLARQLAGMRPTGLAAGQELLRDMVSVRADPPRDSAGGLAFFLARLDTLLDHAAFAEARRLMEQVGYDRPEIFRRWFDLALLTGQENRACARMRALPEITPTYPARIFCLARSGDWPAAAVTLETARALGVITPAETERLTRFLDEFADAIALPPPEAATPLDYMLYEAMGEPLRSASLPLPFARADLREHIGWKPQLAAAERLARAGAMNGGELWQVYGRRAPAASGEPWDRVAAAQAFDAALAKGDAAAVAASLPAIWEEMRAARLLPVFSRWAAPALIDLPLEGEPRAIAVEAALLAGLGERVADAAPTPLLRQIAAGEPPAGVAGDGEAGAVAAGLTAAEAPARAAGLLADGRIGEALLYAIELLDRGAAGSLDALSDGLAILHVAGFEDRARLAAIEILLTEPQS